MPIYDQGYETYDGIRTHAKRRWIPLWREEIRPYLKRRVFILLIIIALLPWLFLGVGLTFLHTQLGNADFAKNLMSRLPPMDEAWIAQLLSNGWTTFMLIIVSVWVGSGLVARDRKEQTLEVFLGRALGPVQYLWAKAAALGVFLLGFTFVPTVIVVIFQVGLTGDVPFLWQHARILWGTLLYALVGIGAFVLFVLALSSLSRSPRIVGLALIGILFFGPAVSGILWAITHKTLVWYFSPIVELKALAFMCLGVHPRGPIANLGDFHVAFFFLLMVVASLAVLTLRFYRRRVLR